MMISFQEGSKLFVDWGAGSKARCVARPDSDPEKSIGIFEPEVFRWSAFKGLIED